MTEPIPLHRLRPTWAPIWLTCKACSHEWDDWQPIHVPLSTWIAHVKSYHCPNCGQGRRSLLLRNRPPNARFGAP